MYTINSKKWIYENTRAAELVSRYKNLLKLDNVSINIQDNHHLQFCHIRPPNWHIDCIIIGNTS